MNLREKLGLWLMLIIIFVALGEWTAFSPGVSFFFYVVFAIGGALFMDPEA